MTYQEACTELEVSPEATLEEIKKSYRSLISFYHPDNFQENEAKRQYAEEKTKRLNAAWAYIEQNYEAYKNARNTSRQSHERAQNGDGNTVETDSWFDIFSDPSFDKKEYLKGLKCKQRAEMRALKAIKAGKRYSDPEIILIIKTCAYGILLRQASEYIVRSLVISHGGEDLVSRGNQDFIRDGIAFLMDNQIIDNETYYTLEELRRLTNNIVHIQRPIEGESLFVECQKLYTQHFRAFIQNIVQWNHVNLYYLITLKDELDNFDGNDLYKFIFHREHRVTRILAKGVLMRRCLEYIVNKKVVHGTKNVAIQNRIELALREKIDTVFSGNCQSALHRIRQATNEVIHVDVRYYSVNQNGYELRQDRVLSSCYSDLWAIAQNRYVYIPRRIKVAAVVLLCLYGLPLSFAIESEVIPKVEAFIEDLRCTEEDKAWKEVYHFVKVNDGYAVYPRSKDISGVVEIPATFAGKPVVEIAEDAFRGCKEITEIILPDTIETIGESAFAYCKKIKTVTIPSSVVDIEKGGSFSDGTFEGCESLESLHVGKGVSTLIYHMFSGCDNLKTIFLTKDLREIEDYTFSGCNNITDIYFDGAMVEWGDVVIGNRAFSSQCGTITVHCTDGVIEIIAD